MSDPAVTLPSYDLFDPEVLRDPMPLLREIRAESPVCLLPQLGAYLVTRHADVVSLLKDKRLTTGNLSQGLNRLSQAEQDELIPLRTSMALWMGHTNEEDHVRFQQLLKRYFTPATVNGLRPRIRELTGELLDAVAPRGRMDVVADLAYPLPANVIAEMLGMPTSHREQLQAWSRDIMAVFRLADIDLLRMSQRSVLEMQDYLRGLVQQRRDEPRDDLLSVFVAAEREGLVNEDEIVANCVLLLFAGHETTANLIANGLALLFDNPDQFALLKSDPALTPGAVEEMLRCGGPASTVVRVSTEPVEVGGVEFPAGTQFYLAMVAGNHDPEVFEDPERFDIRRKPNRHTAFGLGSFYCLGAALARTETDECFRVLLERCPDIRPDYDTPDRISIPPLGQRLVTLNVRF
ncbi:cytochrome P450 [Saccharothrix coeruleofusca]|uniref:Cytochrome P450 n=1 Tax=Saccharothrix coeruleofusca TaxID=33919 RepID=A0A918EHA4_9PSEU|nr:cytochrome P450 [Saccharothrix coeruleofusca]MBP2335435.1 cytochrome P450 [Saccharothrix coeruleofusca]GGP77759.1 cytochrome P450 [Saccharothrix coeruleofusca]